MKIETEVHNSLCAFSSAEGKHGGGGCSVSNGEPPPIAQDGSIGRPERQQSPPGCDGGCGPCSSANNNNSASHPKSDFDCEHFQYIDEDVTDDDDVPATETSAEQQQRSSPSPPLPPAATTEIAAPATDDTVATTNGTATDPPPVGSHLITTSAHQVNGNDTKMPQDDAKHSHHHHHHKSHNTVKRQGSIDDSSSTTPESRKEAKSVLKSLLKKGRKSSSKRRVTFDEAVTLYSDESEEVQLLQLTTGPDIVYTEVFYMFEPPIEYQDVPPFEPPAEYRDSDEQPNNKQQQQEPQPVVESEIIINSSSDVVEETNEPADESKEEEMTPTIDDNISKDIEQTSNNNESTETSEEPVVEKIVVASSNQESDRLFERFSEAEREFAIDEELNSVFRELNSEFGTNCTNGELSNDYFRSLITCLTAAECGIPVSECEFFSPSKFDLNDICLETADEITSKSSSRTLSEADSDCSISSQDTIIVRNEEEEENELYQKSNRVEENIEETSISQTDSDSKKELEERDEVFNDADKEASSEEEKPRPLPRDSLLGKTFPLPPGSLVKIGDKVNGESLSRQSSGEQSVNSGNSQDHPQDADDSTSSDSRSGEVEEEIRLDDIGYDEEDAEDYDEESFRGMAHGNSKIRRIIKKNALQCTLFRGIEAKRRQQPGIKYPRPKSPLLSQESLVEKLKWLTTIDEQKDADCPPNFHSKPPDVILSTGGVPSNSSMQRSASSEDDVSNQTNQNAMQYQQAQYYHRVMMPPNSKGSYYIRHDGHPPTYYQSLPRQRVSCAGHNPQMMPHAIPYSSNRMVVRSPNSQLQWSDQRNNGSMTVPRNFRDWRVIQRVMVSRSGDGHSRSPQIHADYVRCANGNAPVGGYTCNVPPDVSRATQLPPNMNPDELVQFVEKDTVRLERIRKRYSMAEEDDDPTFGFARRPSVRGVQSGIQSNPSDAVQGHGSNQMDTYVTFDEVGQGPPQMMHPRSASYNADQLKSWCRDPNWRPENGPGPHYGQPTISSRSQAPMHIHRASVALTELPGSATIPYTHRKPHPDPRYHSYAESMYGSTRTLPTKGWPPADTRTCHSVSKPNSNHPISTVPMPVSPPMLQIPPHPGAKDERGVPEGASSSPKVSQDSLYNAPVPADPINNGGPHKDESVIYYSLNV